MADRGEPGQWPPRWELPPPSDPAPPVVAPPHPPTVPQQRGADPAGPYPTYALPPDVPPPPTTWSPPPAPPSAPDRQPPVSRGAFAVAAGVAVVVAAAALLIVQRTAPSVSTPPASTTYAPARPGPQPAATQPAAPAPTDPGTALHDQAQADRSTLATVTEGAWVPQLSSKRVGLVADGITYTEQAIWNDHRSVRQRVPGAALLWSGDYATFSGRDFWVTVVPSEASDSPDVVNQWCAAQGFPADDCFAKRLGTSSYSRNTAHR